MIFIFDRASKFEIEQKEAVSNLINQSKKLEIPPPADKPPPADSQPVDEKKGER